MSFEKERIGIAHLGVTDEQGIRMGFRKICQVCQSLGVVPRLQVGDSKIVSDVIAEVSGMNLGATQRIDRFGIISIQHMRIA